MPTFRHMLLGAAALVAIAVPAVTQSQSQSSQRLSSASPYHPPSSFDGVTLYYPQTGRMVADHLAPDEMKAAMQHATPVKGPFMVVQSGGQAYVVQDMKNQRMPDGSMMVEHFEKKMMGAPSAH